MRFPIRWLAISKRFRQSAFAPPSARHRIGLRSNFSKRRSPARVSRAGRRYCPLVTPAREQGRAEHWHSGSSMAMNRTYQQRLSRGAVALARWTAGEFLEILPAVLFFFIALMLILAMLKLFISQYSIEFYAFSRAAVGALILGKVVLLMDWAESGRRVSTYPRIMVIACKTCIYGLAVLTLGIGERLIHAYRRTGDFRDAVRMVIANANLDRFLGCVLL